MPQKYSLKKLNDAIIELEREMSVRQQRYPLLIEQRKLSKEVAARRCENLKIAIDLLKQLKKEPELKKQLKLF